jgi:hypothetical protein
MLVLERDLALAGVRLRGLRGSGRRGSGSSGRRRDGGRTAALEAVEALLESPDLLSQHLDFRLSGSSERRRRAGDNQRERGDRRGLTPTPGRGSIVARRGEIVVLFPGRARVEALSRAPRQLVCPLEVDQ